MLKPATWGSALLSLAVFAVAGNLCYDWLLSAVAGSGSITFITDEPNGALAHRLLTVGSCGFFGFVLGLDIAACKWLTGTREAAQHARTWLTVIALGAPLLSFVFIRAQVRAFTSFVDVSGISVALPLEDVPLHQIGVFAGLCVLAHLSALSMMRVSRKRTGAKRT